MRGRKDSNQNEIVEILESAHLDVIDLSSVPVNLPELADAPDIVVGGMHQVWKICINILVEIKTDKGKLRAGQVESKDRWRGRWIVARTADDILKEFGYDI